MGDFYGTGIEIWAGFGLIGIAEINEFGPNFSWAKKIKNIVASALKNCMKCS